MALLSSKKKARTAGRSDPVVLLIADHEKVERLFTEIERAESPVQQVGLVAQLDHELTRHTEIEEQIVYPFIRANVEGGDAMVDEAEEEHAEAKEVLARVSTLDPSSAGFAGELKALKKLVRHHVKEEEKDVFHRLDSEVDAPALNRLRGDLERAKLAETPSPSLPSE